MRAVHSGSCRISVKVQLDETHSVSNKDNPRQNEVANHFVVSCAVWSRDQDGRPAIWVTPYGVDIGQGSPQSGTEEFRLGPFQDIRIEGHCCDVVCSEEYIW